MVTGAISKDFKENGIDKSYDEIFLLICENMEIEIGDERFIYCIDSNYVMDTSKGLRTDNLTPGYDKILASGLMQLKYPEQEITNSFCISYNYVLDGLSLLAGRILEKLRKSTQATEKQKRWFERIKDQPAESFEEAIQRLLLINQMFWQTGHRLIGLGAWDFYLQPYYEADCLKGRLNRQEALAVLEDLYHILHKHYLFKSNVLMGDTGQIFVLGRTNPEGEYLCNPLTYLFIEAMKNVQLTEPKCFLRVNKNTPRDLLELAVEAIATGIGAPLLANDDMVIPALTEFGIEPQDACMYATAACWEPLIAGKSSSMNNIRVFNYLKAMDNLLRREKLDQINSFEKLVERYLFYLRLDLKGMKRIISTLRFQYDPLLSVFTDDCFVRKMDVSWGGAKYHDIGVTSVAMGNLINVLFFIKDLVFTKKEYSLYDVKQAVILNFEGKEDLRKRLQMKASVWGTDDEDVINLVNQITACAAEELAEYRSYLNGKMRMGLSGSAYIDEACNFYASFDGRRFGDPFIVHISNEDNHAFTEIVNFASQLNYSRGQFNGNVIDFMISPDFIHKNWDKFIDFIALCIKKGFFEMQMNVIGSKTLTDAKKYPEKFPNLIVRVWGFSAYFKDLPEEYQEVLIARALKNEGAT